MQPSMLKQMQERQTLLPLLLPLLLHLQMLSLVQGTA
jgi:hypothetical protein